MTERRWLRLIVPLVVAALAITSVTFGQSFGRKPAALPQEEPAEPELPGDLAQTHAEVLRFVAEMESALSRAMQDPRLAGGISTALERNRISLPFTDAFHEMFETASAQELRLVAEMLRESPELLELPALLNGALDAIRLPVVTLQAAGDCTGNYGAFQTFKQKRSTIRILTRANNILAIAHRGLKLAKELVGAPTEDTPFVGRLPALILIGLTGLADIGINAVSLASDVLAFQKDEQELSIAACCTDATPSEQLFGRGCDNRDNNCAGGIDEPSEDNFAPTVEIESGTLSRCYPDSASALTSLKTAVSAADDCSVVSPDVDLNVSATTCTGIVMISASDPSGNTTSVGPLTVTVDEVAPLLQPPSLLSCYPTLTAARNDLARTVVHDCTAVRTDVDVVAAECAADLTFNAVDECNRRSEHREQVRVDGTEPQVRIRKLLLPSVDGTFCFASAGEAVDAVASVAVISDNCTPLRDLTLNTRASGSDVCNLTISTSAVDQCGLTGIDTLPARVDTTPPVVSCSVAVPKLWPADGTMIDVGLAVSATDDCDTTTEIPLEVMVTSDEPTALARRTLGADPYPDAELLRDAAGRISGLRLRAERTDYGPADGRVYRIRVTATDSCGLSSHTDCWVNVPRQINSGQAINSGQNYDATRVN